MVRGGYSCLGKDENSVESAEMMNCDKEYVEKMEDRNMKETSVAMSCHLSDDRTESALNNFDANVSPKSNFVNHGSSLQVDIN